MANTFSQIYIQLVFAVKWRERLIHEDRREELQKYISGIVGRKGEKLLAIYCMPDHTHLLLNIKPEASISALAGEIKSNSAKFINSSHWFRGQFAWQSGFGAFSYSISQIDDVIHYIQNQKEHHAKRTFRDEYLAFLRKFKVDFDERYLFDFHAQ